MSAVSSLAHGHPVDFNFLQITLCVSVLFLNICQCAKCMHAHEDQKRVLNPLELVTDVINGLVHAEK